MSTPIPIRNFPEHMQLVIAALTGDRPRNEWRKLRPVCRMLLVAAVTLRYPDSYHGPDGYLLKNFRELSNELFGGDYGNALGNSARMYNMVKMSAEGSNRSCFITTPQMQELLDALNACEKVFDPSFPERLD